jgi:hypothetical protein
LRPAFSVILAEQPVISYPPSMRHSRLLTLLASVCSIVGCGNDVQQVKGRASKLDATQSAPVSVSGIETAPGLAERELIGPLRDAFERIDPAVDGWQSEALSDAATSQLTLLTQALEAAERRDASFLSEFVAADFSAPPLRPSSLEREFQADGFTVRRSAPNQQVAAGKPFAGTAGLKEAIESWLAGIKDAGSHPHAKLKLYRVEPRGGGLTSHVLCTLSCESSDTRTQINATWVCDWTVASPEPLQLKLKSIGVEAYEEVVAARGAARFEDCTESILGTNACWQDQFLRGTDYWRARLPRDFGLDVAANHGLAVGDVNGDQLDDLYICQQGGLPNRLFLQNADGTLRDVSEESGTAWLDYCASALFIDLDNDGDRDLAVSQDFRLLLMENDGTGKFELAFGTSTQAQSFSMAAADYDVDGDVDLYVCGYNPSAANIRSGAMGEPLPFHDANNGGRNTLWRNNGNWRFTDVTAETGLDQNNTRFSFAACWEDFDNDGDLDLYVANDYGRNNLYRNDGGRFDDVAADLGVEDQSAGMSVTWADCNRDGWMDLYVSNMFSGAGNRITYQRQFKEGFDDDTRQQFQRMARGNSLFLGHPDGRFRDVSEPAGVAMGRWAWGSRFADVNNDGWEDILVTNGFITAADVDDL